MAAPASHAPTLDDVVAAHAALRQRHPLVQALTNSVSTNFVANVLLAAGAAPAMVDNPEEAALFAGIADAVLINLGTPTSAQVESMRLAAAAAQKAGKPWVLDPIAAGALPWRGAVAAELLQFKPAIVRGNASEIIGLAGLGGGGRGVDSSADPAAAVPAAVDLLAHAVGRLGVGARRSRGRSGRGRVDAGQDRRRQRAPDPRHGHRLRARRAGRSLRLGRAGCADRPRRGACPFRRRRRACRAKRQGAGQFRRRLRRRARRGRCGGAPAPREDRAAGLGRLIVQGRHAANSAMSCEEISLTSSPCRVAELAQALLVGDARRLVDIDQRFKQPDPHRRDAAAGRGLGMVEVGVAAMEEPARVRPDRDAAMAARMAGQGDQQHVVAGPRQRPDAGEAEPVVAVRLDRVPMRDRVELRLPVARALPPGRILGGAQLGRMDMDGRIGKVDEAPGVVEVEVGRHDVAHVADAEAEVGDLAQRRLRDLEPRSDQRGEEQLRAAWDRRRPRPRGRCRPGSARPRSRSSGNGSTSARPPRGRPCRRTAGRRAGTASRN